MRNKAANHRARLATTRKYREGLVDMVQAWLRQHKTCGGEGAILELPMKRDGLETGRAKSWELESSVRRL